jgi:hypothetical protein
MAPAEFVQWLPITDAERQLKAPEVEKDAGAEILQWRVRVVDEITGEDLQRVLYHYIRVKVFDEKGKTAASTVDLPYRAPGNINSISGRTIKADGSITELDSKTVYRRDLVRSGLKETVVSFAMPAVEPGAIVEYRWKQIQNDRGFRYLRLNFARELPVQKVTYFVRPLSSDYIATDQMFFAPFNCQPTPLKPTNDGWTETSVVNVPATRDEPNAPSKPNIEPWALLYYADGSGKDPQKYWNNLGKNTYNEMKTAMKASDELKAAAVKINATGKIDEEKIALMVAYVRESLRDYFSDAVSEAERTEFRKKLPKGRDRTSTEILKSGIAISSEMNVVLGALATQAGFDAHPALVADRDEIEFNANLANSYFLDVTAMAIKLGEKWNIFDVTHRYLKPGMLSPDSEGTFALVTDPKTSTFVPTPVTAPEDSAENRTATLVLKSDGSIEGDVKEAYTGHRAALYRLDLDGDSAEQQEKWFSDRMTSMFPDAKITGFKLENLANPSMPLEISYHLAAPQFAQVTGRRILFEPNVFRNQQGARFTASDRKAPIQFRYGWKESDQLRISLPDGFALESAENPGDLDFGDPGHYKLALSVDGKDLVVAREFVFGQTRLLSFQREQYPNLKAIFEQIHLRDTASFSLRGN